MSVRSAELSILTAVIDLVAIYESTDRSPRPWDAYNTNWRKNAHKDYRRDREWHQHEAQFDGRGGHLGTYNEGYGGQGYYRNETGKQITWHDNSRDLENHGMQEATWNWDMQDG